MDLYGLQSARAEGNARTANNDLYNEQIKTARDRINNTLDSEKITAQGNLRGQQSTDTQDKVIYDIHDAMSGTGFARSLSRISESVDAYNKAKASLGEGGLGTFLSSQTALSRGKVDKVFGSATNTGDKVAQVVTNKVPPTQDELDRAETARVQADPDRVGATSSDSVTTSTGAVFRRQDLTDENDPLGAPPLNNSTPSPSEVNNRPKTNEPASANENTPDIPDKPPTTTDELSGKVLSTTEKVKEGFSKAGTGLRVLNDVGGAVGTYEMFKNGFTKNADGSTDRWNEVSQIAGAVGTGLDIVGAFIPALEPLGNLAQVVGSVADTIDQHEKDDTATTQAQNEVDNVETQRKNQLASLPSEKISSAPVNTMVSGGLVGTQAQHINTTTQGTGTF